MKNITITNLKKKIRQPNVEGVNVERNNDVVHFRSIHPSPIGSFQLYDSGDKLLNMVLASFR